MIGSKVFAGIDDATESLPNVGEIITSATISSFTATGALPFADSNLAAETIGSLLLKGVAHGGESSDGVRARVLRSIKVFQAGRNVFNWTNKIAPSLLTGIAPDMDVALV
jgi:hypothetical protein